MHQLESKIRTTRDLETADTRSWPNGIVPAGTTLKLTLAECVAMVERGDAEPAGRLIAEELNTRAMRRVAAEQKRRTRGERLKADRIARNQQESERIAATLDEKSKALFGDGELRIAEEPSAAPVDPKKKPAKTKPPAKI